MFHVIFSYGIGVADSGSVSFAVLLMEGLRNHNFIIPRPKQIIKRKIPKMSRIIYRTSADFLPGACRGEHLGRPVAGVPH
jgi:hypothetical protein